MKNTSSGYETFQVDYSVAAFDAPGMGFAEYGAPVFNAPMPAFEGGGRRRLESQNDLVPEARVRMLFPETWLWNSTFKSK